MSEKTPKRPPNRTSNAGFSPVTLAESPASASPQKNLTGLPRVVRDLTADIYNTIQRWNDLHITGTNFVKKIASLKADSPQSFAPPLEDLTNDLYNTVQSLQRLQIQLATFVSQIKAIGRLHAESSQPLFISLDINALTNLVEAIATAYEAEYKVKEFILENIAHVKNEDDAMFFAALWTYQYKITDNINLKLETLLIETGHRKFN